MRACVCACVSILLLKVLFSMRVKIDAKNYPIPDCVRIQT